MKRRGSWRRNRRLREAAKVIAEVFLHSEEGRKMLSEMSEAFNRETVPSDENGKENQ